MKNTTASLGGFSARPFGLRALLEEENKGDGADLPKSAPSATPDLAALQARLAEYEQRDAKRASDDAAAAEAAKKQAQIDGDTKKQLELQAKELEALKARAGDADLGKQFREREEKRIAELKAKLTPEQQSLIDAQPSVLLKGALLDQFTKTTTTAAPKPAEGTRGGSPPGDTPDYASAFRDSAKWAELKKSDPEGTKRFVADQMSASRPGNTKPLAFLH